MTLAQRITAWTSKGILTAVIVVAGGDGVIRHRQAGLGTGDALLVAAVRAAQ